MISLRSNEYSSFRSAWLATALWLTACGGNEGTPTTGGELATGQQACAERCAILTEVACPDVQGKTPSQCEESCRQVLDFFPQCQPQFLALANCPAARTTAAWKCADTGESVVVAGVCDDQKDALAQCLSGS